MIVIRCRIMLGAWIKCYRNLKGKVSNFVWKRGREVRDVERKEMIFGVGFKG